MGGGGGGSSRHAAQGGNSHEAASLGGSGDMPPQKNLGCSEVSFGSIFSSRLLG